jgi:hypothetical protein
MSKFQADGWAEVRAELAKLRAELAALAPAGKKAPLERLKAKLAALESKIGQTA